MSDLYETEFGIFNHAAYGVSRPLSSIAFHPSEDYTDNSLLEDSYRNYVRKGIKEIFNLSLEEYMNLTRDKIYLLHKIADEEGVKNNHQIENIKNDLKQNK